MALGGLWHGAAWNFVAWGAYQGTGLSAEHAINGRLGRIFPGWLRWFVTFNLIVVGWILFRSTDLACSATTCPPWSAPARRRSTPSRSSARSLW